MESNTELQTINEDSLSVELSSINLRDTNLQYDPNIIRELLLNKFDNKKKYKSVSVIVPSQDLEAQMASGVDEAERNQIAVLPICVDESWVSVSLWKEDDKIKVLHNDPKGNPISEVLKNSLASFNVEVIDLQFSQQINPVDSGVFTVDNLTKVTDFLLNYEDLIDRFPTHSLATNLKLESSTRIGETLEGQERKVSADVNSISNKLRHNHNNVLNEIKEDKTKNLSTTFRPIYDHKSRKLLVPDSRPPGPFGKNQGEHVTNWSLYKRAVKKIIEGNAENLEVCKNELISLVGSLTLEGNKDRDNEFLNHINDVVRDYNSGGRTSHHAVENKAQRDAINREAQDKVLAEMARITLSTINRLPDITHPEEGNIKAGTDASTAILNHFDKAQRVEEVPNLSQDILKLMHYPYVPEATLKSVEEVSNIRYEGETNSLKYTKRDLKTRTNLPDTLSDVMARHLNAVSAAYPRLIDIDVIKDVIQKKSDQWLSAAQIDGKSGEYLDHFISEEGENSKFYEAVVSKMAYRRKELSPTKPPKTTILESSDSGSNSLTSSLDDAFDIEIPDSSDEEKEDIMIDTEIIIGKLEGLVKFYRDTVDKEVAYNDVAKKVMDSIQNCQDLQFQANESKQKKEQDHTINDIKPKIEQDLDKSNVHSKSKSFISRILNDRTRSKDDSGIKL